MSTSSEGVRVGSSCDEEGYLLNGSDDGVSEVGGLSGAIEGEEGEEEREGGGGKGLCAADTLTQHTQSRQLNLGRNVNAFNPVSTESRHVI